MKSLLLLAGRIVIQNCKRKEKTEGLSQKSTKHIFKAYLTNLCVHIRNRTASSVNDKDSMNHQTMTYIALGTQHRALLKLIDILHLMPF